MVNIKQHPINIGHQAGKIKHLFPDSSVSFGANTLTWKYSLQPTPMSITYDVKLVYQLNQDPNVFITSPKLKFAEGKKALPHVYDTDKQWLCLYYRKAREWNSTMLLVDTVIPWTAEWLFFYEIWSVTGIWNGGGITHGNKKKS